MATKEEKQELIEILKFTPITVTMRIQGYGGECYAGTVDRKIYEYFKSRKIDMDEYSSDWDGEMNVPSERQPYPPGSAYECDNLFHASGAELSNLNTLEVEDEDYNTIWAISLGYSELEDAGVTVQESGGGELDDLCKEDDIVLWGGQGEKGCFFDAKFTLRAPFDPKKLTIYYENCDDWYIITSVEYDGEELDGTGGYSTTGKWAESKWILMNGEEVYESVLREDMEELIETINNSTTTVNKEPAVTEWFDKEIKPAYKGEYDVALDAEWPLSGIIRAEWNGRTWKDTDGNKVKIKSWRGLAENPNGE